MAASDPDAESSDDRALRLLINTPVTLFWRTAILEETTAWLSAHGYQVTRIDAAHWSTERDLHRDIAAALSFPDHYGRNLDALNDCLRDVAGQVYGWAPGTAGLAIVFTGYDAFARCCPHAALAVLDTMAGASRRAALFGRRLMCLVQSDDPDIRFDPVGATPVVWNDAERLEARRRPD
ncbi:MAG TPA: barstar family protein [Actinophytocola sp.]|uniref:barstar family protein n=1 Tax=Actinophytocola sp. TaxID=1872138 RepID=UPI002DDD109B|nr:barstar family protein [Actinophytocola sp.]HEV2778619.1 barstar family protein [Actinophytocola sp.]